MTQTARIMVVADDAQQASWLRLVLEEAGYQADVFTEFSAFHAALKNQEPPAAVIMDMMFPEGDDARARAIAEMKAQVLQAVPIVFFSERQDVEARLAAHRAGATRCLSKPVDREVLLSAIANSAVLAPMRPYRVLVVDDSTSQLVAHAYMLRSAGMEVREADNPLLVSGILEDFAADVLLLDIYMPQCSGPELAAVLRDDERYTQIPIVYLSTETNVARQLQALDSGGEHFLLKPVDPGHLARVVGMHAWNFRLSVELAEDLRAARYTELRKQEALDTHAIVSIADVSGNIIYVNDKFCAISGYTRAELLGNNHHIVKSGIHPSEFYADIWHTISSGHVWHGELCNRAKNGSLYWVETTIVPFLGTDGLPYQYISMRTDITHLKTAVAEIENLSQRLEIATEYSGVGVWDFDLVHDKTSWNQVMYRLYDVDQGKKYLTYEDWRLRLHPDDAERLAEEFRLVLGGGKPYDTEFRVIWKNGEVHWLKAMATVHRDKAGKPIRMIGTNWDITESKRIDQLLIDAKEAAEIVSHSKSEFLASMSHELRTPLNAILGFSQLLGMNAGLHQEMRDHAQEIEHAGQHLLALVNDMIDLARIEAGKLELSQETVPVGTVLKEALVMVESLARARGIRLDDSACANQQATVHADRVRLRQVLLNLLSNAIKYNVPGGAVRLSCQVNDGSLRITVIDTGPGIPLDKQERIFNAFDRLGEERGDVEGTGIGLVITKRIVEAMGGNVGFESAPGQGSRFWLEFPVSAEVAVQPVVHKIALGVAPVSAQSIRPRVLYVEDNPMNLRLMQQIFASRKNLELLYAETAEEGVALAQAEPPALILMDINLPGMDGYAALEVLRADARTAHIPVIAISANAMKGDLECGMEAGFTDYLTKPLDVAHFLAILDRLFGVP